MAQTIGALGKVTGTKVETIRYYERIGLLAKPPRTRGNYRLYGEAELARLSFIRRARALGFPLDQVRALLALSSERDQDCAKIDAIARDHLAEVEQKIAALNGLRRALVALVASCQGSTVAECHIIEALGPERRENGSNIAVSFDS